MKKILFIIMILSIIGFGSASDEARLMRFPDINGNLVTFVYAGDIWTVPANGGTAKHLTSHEGMELFPKISPDGKWIAFSAEYSGSRQIYVMSSEGGTPKQLTYYNDVGFMPPRGGWDYVVLDWTPDSKQILFRGNRTPFGKRVGKYFLVNREGGFETPLEIPDGGFGSFSPDGKKLCYTPIGREFRTWKRYKGGRASDVWIYDLEKSFSKQLTKFKGSDQIPSWYKDKIYYASDESLTLNIHSYDLKNGKTEQITKHREYDVMWPSGEGSLLVYENGGYLLKLDLESGKESKIPVLINYDGSATLPYFKNVKDNIAGMSISPTGKRALFDARGDIFSVPAKHGEIVNLTKTQGIRDMSPEWSPDGKYIAFTSDRTGEYEIYIQDAGINNPPIQLTTNSTAWKYNPLWSPDSKKLLYSDRTNQLKILYVATKREIIADKGRSNDIFDYSWSPDSRWVTYSKDSRNDLFAVWVYSLETGSASQLTNDRFNDNSPVFSTCGKYLFFRSNRDFNLTFSSFEFDYVYNKASKIYALALGKNTPPLFKDKDDVEEVKKIEADSSGKKKPAAKKKAGPSGVKIDFENTDSRIVALPITSSNYFNLESVEGGILYNRKGTIYKFDIAKKKEEKILANVRAIVLSSDKKKGLYRSGSDYGIIPIKPGNKPGTGKLKLCELKMKIEPVKEWKQIYNDGWRIFRDWFYAKNLHGVDWKKMGERYGKLLPHVKHRADLDYLFGELVGESNTGHCYVNYGDFPRVKRMDTGLLGAELAENKKSGRYIIKKIFKGENWNSSRRSPLTEQGINIKEGDTIISINNRNVTTKDNPYMFLENTVGKKISIVISNSSGQKEYKIKPISSELKLFYLDWVESRRALVDKLSNGRIGYIHAPNTSFEGNRELFKGMYAFHNKEALIIDDRYNGGGFIPDVMVDLLGRKTLAYWAVGGVKPFRTPGVLHEGPKAMLINHYASSGGDAFPYFFKKRGLGVLIGTRTWGGLVGLSGNAGFVDGGSFNVPTFGFFNTEGKWAVEGVGVYPDIEVIDTPHLVAKGIDPGIEAAVKYLLNELKKNPVKKVKQPEDPDRSKWIEQKIK
ncbi:MAG: PDZ domain-containing protein [Acidobacteriota bacterium]